MVPGRVMCRPRRKLGSVTNNNGEEKNEHWWIAMGLDRGVIWRRVTGWQVASCLRWNNQPGTAFTLPHCPVIFSMPTDHSYLSPLRPSGADALARAQKMS